MKLLKSHKTFGGKTEFWSHDSFSTKTEMKFSTFTPEGEVRGCLIWLSGLTCNEENFITKAGAQKYLAENGLMVVCPDTSPRGLDLSGEHEAYDFGSGAGFYVDAKTEGYSQHYNMYSYITSELYELLKKEFKVTKFSLFGHSMGGHGALVIGLRNPDLFRAISAYSPIVNPMDVEWGKKAFTGYLGTDSESWKSYDACELLKSGSRHPEKILIHQGEADDFLKNQLKTERIKSCAEAVSQSLELKMCPGYDHSYYFISTFMEEHISHHSRLMD